MATVISIEKELSEAAEKLKRNDGKLAQKIAALAKHKAGQSKNRKAQQIIVANMLKGRRFKINDIRPWLDGEELSFGFAIWNLVNRDLVKVVEPGTYSLNRRPR